MSSCKKCELYPDEPLEIKGYYLKESEEKNEEDHE